MVSYPFIFTQYNLDENANSVSIHFHLTSALNTAINRNIVLIISSFSSIVISIFKIWHMWNKVITRATVSDTRWISNAVWNILKQYSHFSVSYRPWTRVHLMKFIIILCDLTENWDWLQITASGDNAIKW